MKEEFGASKLMAPELFWAVKRRDVSDNVSNFLTVLEELASEDEMHASDIVEQVTCGGSTILHLAVQNRSQEILRLIANHFPQLITRTNIARNTALHLAARNKGDGLINIILTCYAEGRLSSGSPIYDETEMNLLRIKNEIGNAALHEAVWKLHLNGARLLSEADKDVANYLNNEEKILRKNSELIYLKDQRGGTALHLAASMGNLEVVRTILNECPPSALEWDLKGYLPIHIACKKGHVNVVEEFVQKQKPWFDPMDSLNQKGQNILHIAAKKWKRQSSKILLLLTQEKRLNNNLVNKEGMTARDIVMLKRRTPPTFREFLSFTILKSIGTPLSENGRRIRRSHTEPPQIKWIKDRVNAILLVAILVATVTFTVGFTMPSGVYSFDDKDMKKRGMATFLNKYMFQLFTICDVIAMYSSTMGSSILLWAQLGDFHIAFNATYFALYLASLALITMSVAFMVAMIIPISGSYGKLKVKKMKAMDETKKSIDKQGTK
ncbi:protein ACCELERATED CELL DEATH 6-like [Prosopis cineraria]|uniref:protein ACCELERATED CELL DEATH 6-like n=1 Tax=Prosopis cineraria TaxID=364024 RepID=UPI00240F9089|nr:protein ACCELERATED CELL DEATH 6-like [Prosopis cineraria]